MSSPSSYDLTLNNLKKKINILILGAYDETYPNGIERSCIDLLSDVKAFLVNKGFSSTHLVKDWDVKEDVPSDAFPEFARDKSFNFVENWAEICVFIFFKDINNSSAIREFSRMVDCAKEKCKNAIVLRQGGVDLRSIIRGDMKIERITEITFEDAEDLLDFAFSGCTGKLFSLKADQYYEKV